MFAINLRAQHSPWQLSRFRIQTSKRSSSSYERIFGRLSRHIGKRSVEMISSRSITQHAWPAQRESDFRGPICLYELRIAVGESGIEDDLEGNSTLHNSWAWIFPAPLLVAGQQQHTRTTVQTTATTWTSCVLPSCSTTYFSHTVASKKHVW